VDAKQEVDMLTITTPTASAHRSETFTHGAAIAWLCALWLLVGAAPCSAQPRTAVAFIDGVGDPGPAVDACVQSTITAHDIPGMAVAVVMNGEIAYERGYGVKHRDQGGAVDENTLFRHGSTGKMITAAAVMRLVDEGRINLDDPVTEYVPELHFAPGLWSADQIRVRHLIENSAAIPSDRDMFDGSLTEWAATLAEVPLLARPGSMWSYSNSNFALAALVVERASGMAFHDYAEAELYRPAGMDDATRYPAKAVASGNYSFGHADDGTVYGPDDYTDKTDGFVSAHDLALWAQIMMTGGGDVLSRGAAAMMQERHEPMYYASGGPPMGIDGGHYGFGIFVDDYPDAVLRWHDGGIPGWVSNLSWIRSEGFAVAILANSWPSAHQLQWDIAECVYDELLGVSFPDMTEPSDPSTWSRYKGTYDAVFEDGYEFEAIVELEGDTLFITVPDYSNPTENITSELECLHGSTFRFWPNPSSWWTVSFIPGEGNPAPISWIRNNRFVGQRRVEARQGGSRRRP
jgi:CubicO group peptidase (beta-lactamase class C family)